MIQYERNSLSYVEIGFRLLKSQYFVWNQRAGESSPNSPCFLTPPWAPSPAGETPAPPPVRLPRLSPHGFLGLSVGPIQGIGSGGRGGILRVMFEMIEAL